MRVGTDTPEMGSNSSPQNTASIAVPWSVRASWVVILLAVPTAFLISAASRLIPESSLRSIVALSLTELGFVIPVIAFFLWRRIAWSWLGFRAFAPAALALGCGALIVTYSLTILHNSILIALHLPTQAETIMRFLDMQGSPWGLLIGGVLVGPLAEELVFRGFFFQGLRGAYGTTKAVLVSSAVFAAIHLDLAALIPTFLLGCMLAFVFDRARSVWPGAILHVLLNAVGIGALLLSSLLSTGQ